MDRKTEHFAFNRTGGRHGSSGEHVETYEVSYVGVLRENPLYKYPRVSSMHFGHQNVRVASPFKLYVVRHAIGI